MVLAACIAAALSVSMLAAFALASGANAAGIPVTRLARVAGLARLSLRLAANTPRRRLGALFTSRHALGRAGPTG